MIAFVNIPHTGTRFVLEGLFGRNTGIHGQDATAPVAFTHIAPHTFEDCRAALARWGGFASMRHGLMASWCKRGKSGMELAQRLILQQRLVEEFDMPVLWVDDPERRDAQLARINERFGLALRTDWAPLPSYDTRAAA